MTAAGVARCRRRSRMRCNSSGSTPRTSRRSSPRPTVSTGLCHPECSVRDRSAKRTWAFASTVWEHVPTLRASSQPPDATSASVSSSFDLFGTTHSAQGRTLESFTAHRTPCYSSSLGLAWLLTKRCGSAASARRFSGDAIRRHNASRAFQGCAGIVGFVHALSRAAAARTARGRSSARDAVTVSPRVSIVR